MQAAAHSCPPDLPLPVFQVISPLQAQRLQLRQCTQRAPQLLKPGLSTRLNLQRKALRRTAL